MLNACSLDGLPRESLLALARASLAREAALVYAPEALPTVLESFRLNTEVMDDDQLAHIVRRMGAS